MRNHVRISGKEETGLFNKGESRKEDDVVSYQFYYDNGNNEDCSLIDDANLIGILPERRKDKRRVTRKSIMKWGKLAAGSNADPNSIYYVKLDL